MRYIPQDDRLIVRQDDAAQMSRGGIYLPPTSKDKTQRTGVVLEVGPGKPLDDGTRAPMHVEQGDRIVWPYINGQEIAGSSLIVVRERDVWAVLEG
jgi:chaperonin GroES